MSIDQRIREGLRMTSTELPEADTTQALDAVITGARAAGRRRRMVTVAAVAAVAAAVAGAAVLVLGPGDDRRPSPTGPTTPVISPSTGADRVIARGRLVSYAADASGSVLTVWTTCESVEQPGCGSAWRLGTGAEPLATGLVNPPGTMPAVHAGGGGFVLSSYHRSEGLFVSADGTTTPIRRGCAGHRWPTAPDPGRYVLVPGLIGPYLVDTVAGTACDTTGFQDAPTMSQGQVADDGTFWGLTGDRTLGEGRASAAISRYDGARWRFHALRPGAGQNDSAFAVTGSHVAVLEGANGSAVRGVTLTTDGGATWSQMRQADIPFAAYTTYDSIAFAGGSTVFVADGGGRLWRSTDGSGFVQVEIAGPVQGLAPAGDAVIARLGAVSDDTLVRITEEGTVEPLVVR